MLSLVGTGGGGGGGDVHGGDASVGVGDVGGGDLDMRKRLSSDVQGVTGI